jgi:hypothetical protein
VPPGFRGDYVQLTCTAAGINRGAVRSLDSEVVAGLVRYTVGIYLDGDVAARQAADLLAQRQEELARLVFHQAELARRSKTPAWWHTVSKTMLNVSHSKTSPVDEVRDEVGQAVANIEAAQRAIRQINVQPAVH